MSNFATQLKGEIARIAKKELRAESAITKKLTTQHRSEITALKRRVSELEAVIKRLVKSQSKTKLAVESDSDSKSLRFRVDGFVALRKNLELSAAEMGKLIGVSGQTIYHWESGKSRPRASQLAAIAQVRKLGKRQVAERLSA